MVKEFEIAKGDRTLYDGSHILVQIMKIIIKNTVLNIFFY